MTRKFATGFTLIELLIAVAVLAIISIMAYSGLNSILKSHELLTTQQESFQQLTRLMTQLQKEIRQIVPRPVHDKYNSVLPALKLENSGNILFSFTRAGIPNPSGLQRNSLQRIDYIYAQKTLKKRIWLVVDNNNDADYQEEIIFTDLSQFRIDVLGVNNNWYQQWPVSRSDPADVLPKAVKLTLTYKEAGEITRLLELPL